MSTGQAVKFKQGTQAEYNAAKENQALLENALYFTTDTHRLFLGENELSTALRVTGEDYEGSTNFPSAYNDDSFSTITTTPQTGEIRLGSAATQNVLTLFGPGQYYQKESFGNKYLPTAYAVNHLVTSQGWLRFQGDQGKDWREGSDDFIDVLNYWKNIGSEGVLFRWLGPSQTIPKYYIANPGYTEEAEEDVLLHTNDYVLLIKCPYPVDGSQDEYVYDKNKILVLPFGSFSESEIQNLIDQTLTTKDSMSFKGTVGDSEVQGTFVQSDLISETRKAGDTFKVICNSITISTQNNFEGTEVTCKSGDLLVFAGWRDERNNLFVIKPTDGRTVTPKLYYIPSADDSSSSEEANYTLVEGYTNGYQEYQISLEKNNITVDTSIIPKMIGTSSNGGTPGRAGLVPRPSYGDNNRFLRGDGTWTTPTIMPYATATTMETVPYYDDKVHMYSQITVTSNETLLGYQYCVITFSQDFTVAEGNEKIIFLNTSSSTSAIILPHYRGEDITFIPKGTWMWAKTDNQIYELVGSFGLEWQHV